MDAAASGRSLPDENAAAYGEVVWSWRRDPGATSAVSPAGNGGKKGRFPGESAYKPSNHCAGKAGMSRLYLSNPCAFSCLIAHGAAGAVSARLSLRPLFKRGTTKLQNSGEFEPRECFRLFEN